MDTLLVGTIAAQSEDDNENKAIHTFHRSQRFSRKLKRRLTQRTVYEARALKKQGKEAIHILIYAAELVRIALTFAQTAFLAGNLNGFFWALAFRLPLIHNWPTREPMNSGPI